MLIQLSLLCRTLALFTLCRLAAADQNENLNYRLLRKNSLDAHYPVRFYKPPVNVATALEDSHPSAFGTNVYGSDESGSNRHLGELVSADESLEENDLNAPLHNELSGAAEEQNPVGQADLPDQYAGQNEHPSAVQDDTAGDDRPQSEQLGDLEPDHSNHELSHRIARRKDDKSERPDAKQVIEFNSLDDQPTYSELHDAKNEEDDNGLLKYKAKHDFEYSTNLLNDHSYFFKNAKMLGE